MSKRYNRYMSVPVMAGDSAQTFEIIDTSTQLVVIRNNKPDNVDLVCKALNYYEKYRLSLFRKSEAHRLKVSGHGEVKK